MKAMHIMMFLFIFNIAMTIISVTNIYNLSYTEEMKEDLAKQFGEDIDDVEAARAVTARNIIELAFSQLGVLAIATGATLGASFVSKFLDTGISGKDAFVYGLFGGEFFITTSNSASIFLTIGSSNFGVIILVVAFLFICGIIFVIGLIQVVNQGGWRSFM